MMQVRTASIQLSAVNERIQELPLSFTATTSGFNSHKNKSLAERIACPPPPKTPYQTTQQLLTKVGQRAEQKFLKAPYEKTKHQFFNVAGLIKKR